MNIEDIKIGDRKRELGNIDALIESISKLGLLNPITVSKDNTLIAGYHRLEACKYLGWSIIPANIINVDKLTAELAEIDENLIRNELTVLEQAEHLKKRKEIYEELYPESKPEEQRKKGLNMSAEFISSLKNSKTFTQDLSEKIGVSQRNVRYSIQIANNIPDNLKQEIKGTVIEDSKTDLIKLSRIKTPDLQKELILKVKSGQAKDIKMAIFQQKQEERYRELLNKNTIPLNAYTQKYTVILADPPWRYDFSFDDDSKVKNHYDTMSLEELINLPVEDICCSDAVLFLWATTTKLQEALDLISSWNFKYKTQCIWDKEHIGTGYWFRGRHELLLVATRGNISPPKHKPDSVYSEKRTLHSKKPEYFYEMIERMFPDLPKIELFARQRRDGWDAWGHEISEIKTEVP